MFAQCRVVATDLIDAKVWNSEYLDVNAVKIKLWPFCQRSFVLHFTGWPNKFWMESFYWKSWKSRNRTKFVKSKWIPYQVLHRKVNKISRIFLAIYDIQRFWFYAKKSSNISVDCKQMFTYFSSFLRLCKFLLKSSSNWRNQKLWRIFDQNFTRTFLMKR